jgi:hypothetical protein
MKVRCIRLLNHEGVEVHSSPWLRLGSAYHVLSIVVPDQGVPLFRILTSEEQDPWPVVGLYQATCFEVVSTQVPSNWQIIIRRPFGLSISPVAWQTDSFLEDFYNHEPYSYDIFMREKEIIVREDP